jgi:hypothetical protein
LGFFANTYVYDCLSFVDVYKSYRTHIDMQLSILGFFVSHFVSIKYLHKKTPKITNGFHKKKYAARKKRKIIDFKAYSSEPSFSLLIIKVFLKK